jgi:hypothetical protein
MRADKSRQERIRVNLARVCPPPRKSNRRGVEAKRYPSLSQGKKKDKNKLPANDLTGWSYLCPLTQPVAPTAPPDTVKEYNGFMEKIKRMNIMNAESPRTERMEAARKVQRPQNQDRTDRTRSASFSLY